MPHTPEVLDALTSYLAARKNNTGGGEIPTTGKNISTGKTNLDTTADIRDSIAALVAGGYSRLKSDDPNVKAHIGRILGLLPQKTGQDLLNHIVIQNQLPSFKSLTPQQRLEQFYAINSNNPEVNAVIQKAKSFGYGPIAGFKDSQEVINQQLQSTLPLIVTK